MRDRGSSNGGRTRCQFLAATGAATTAGLAGCTTLMASGDDFDIEMTVVALDPPTVTVEAGDEVVWCNTSSRGYTVTAYEGTFLEGAASFTSGGYETRQAVRDAYSSSLGRFISSGEAHAYSFDVPDKYKYLCIPHEQAGTVDAVVAEERPRRVASAPGDSI